MSTINLEVVRARIARGDTFDAMAMAAACDEIEYLRAENAELRASKMNPHVGPDDDHNAIEAGE